MIGSSPHGRKGGAPSSETSRQMEEEAASTSKSSVLRSPVVGQIRCHREVDAAHDRAGEGGGWLTARRGPAAAARSEAALRRLSPFDDDHHPGNNGFRDDYADLPEDDDDEDLLHLGHEGDGDGNSSQASSIDLLAMDSEPEDEDEDGAQEADGDVDPGMEGTEMQGVSIDNAEDANGGNDRRAAVAAAAAAPESSATATATAMDTAGGRLEQLFAAASSLSKPSLSRSSSASSSATLTDHLLRRRREQQRRITKDGGTTTATISSRSYMTTPVIKTGTSTNQRGGGTDSDDDDDSITITSTPREKERGKATSSTTTTTSLSHSSRRSSSHHGSYYRGSSLDPHLPMSPTTRTLNELSQDPSLANLWYYEDDPSKGTTTKGVKSATPSAAMDGADAAVGPTAAASNVAAADPTNENQDPRGPTAARSVDDTAARASSLVSETAASEPAAAATTLAVAAVATTKRPDKRTRPVAQLDPSTGTLVQLHESIRRAEIDTGIKRQRITEAAKSSGTKAAGGYLWQFQNKSNSNSTTSSNTRHANAASTRPRPPLQVPAPTAAAASKRRSRLGPTSARRAPTANNALVVNTNAVKVTNAAAVNHTGRVQINPTVETTGAQPARATAGAASAALVVPTPAAPAPVDEETADVPFCTKCTTGVGHVHHAWCPKHPQFELSGARAVLERLLLGAGPLGCGACRTEYRQGTRSGAAHSERCRHHAVAAAAEQQRRQEAADAATAAAAAAAAHEKSRAKDRSRPRKLSSTRRANRKDDPQSDYDDDDRDTDSVMSDESRLDRAGRHDSRRSKPQRHSHANAGGGRGRASAPGIDDSDDDGDDDDESPLNVDWKECENPWGPDEYQEGDVVLFSGNTPGTAHIEALLPSPRFVMDPFTVSSPYRGTHHTPQEGFHLVQLRRDPMSRLDWGFRASRHEFGGACLVTAVDALSPASSAVFVAAASEVNADAALRVHDMIILINGKKVGGMMEAVFDIEIESSGASLYLVVSRYKHAATVEDRLQAAERQFHEAVDDALNDHRRLGWVDLIPTSHGRSSQVVPQDSGPPEAAGPSQAAGPPQDVSLQQELVHQQVAPSVREQPHSALNQHGSAPGSLQISGGRAAGTVLTNGAPGSVIQSLEAQQLGRRTSIEDAHGTDVAAEDLAQACLGCVCGIIHDERVPVFWLQCDSCKSWYNVSSQCVMLTEQEAKSLPTWVCWGCPAPIHRDSAAGDGVEVERGTALGQAHSLLAALRSAEPVPAAVPMGSGGPSSIHAAEPRQDAPGALDGVARDGNVLVPAIEPQGLVEESTGVPLREHRGRKSSKATASAPEGDHSPHGHSHAGHSPAVVPSGEGGTTLSTQKGSVSGSRAADASSSPPTSHAQPSETFDMSVFWWKGRWVPVPNKKQANPQKPILAKGARVLYREDGRPEYGQGIVKSTRVDDVLGRFYDVRLPGWGSTVKDVHEHFVDPLPDDE